MIKPITHEQVTANKIANLIDRNSDLYRRCPIFKSMVDATVFLTTDEIHESMGVVGGTLRKWNVTRRLSVKLKGYIVVEEGHEADSQLLIDKGGRGEDIQSHGWTVYASFNEAVRMRIEANNAGIEKAYVATVEIEVFY